MGQIIVVTACVLLLALAIYYFYPERKLPENASVDEIRIYKSKRKMHVFSNGKLLKTYTVSLGKNPNGAKEFEGDFKTPEGIYTINGKNPNSRFHKNLGISYPNASDLAVAEKRGKPAGGAIKIHGIRNGSGFIGKFQRCTDWTAGCVAVTNPEMDELYRATQSHARIEIFP